MSSQTSTGLALIGGMLVATTLPMFVDVPKSLHMHPYLQLLIMAPLLVWTGCQGAIVEAAKEDSKQEQVSKKDAMQFPLFGSAALFSLYLVVKFVPKEYLDLIISLYFSVIGAFAIFGCVAPTLTAALGMGGLKKFNFSIDYELWKAKEKREPLAFGFSFFDVAVFAVCAALSVAYAMTKRWFLNNVLGVAFSLQAIEMLALGSYAIGCILLCGLFFYDIFWVFGTDVMVSVAKGLNAPVKVLFPKNYIKLADGKVECSMLGLGDIVIPGIFVALMLRLDVQKGLKNTPYFTSNLVAYELGLVMTVSVMHVFGAAQVRDLPAISLSHLPFPSPLPISPSSPTHLPQPRPRPSPCPSLTVSAMYARLWCAAQPALLYLVPCCIGASLLMGVYRGELNELLNFSVAKEEAKEGAAKESDKNK